jgi:hypothetical protein
MHLILYEQTGPNSAGSDKKEVLAVINSRIKYLGTHTKSLRLSTTIKFTCKVYDSIEGAPALKSAI